MSSGAYAAALGLFSVLSDLVALLRPFGSYIVPLFWIGFFLVAFTAIYFHRHRLARRGFIAIFFAGLLFFSTIAPVTLLPYVQWHKFGEPWPEEREHNELRVVDAAGNEIPLDNEATAEFEGIRMIGLISAMLGEYDDARNEEVARHLLQEAEMHRKEVQTRSLTDYLRYPRHGHTASWANEPLEDYETFVGVRIYRRTFETSPDGTEITAYDEEMLLEVFPDESADAVNHSTSSPQSTAVATRGVRMAAPRGSTGVIA